MNKKFGIIILLIFFASLAAAIIYNYYTPIKITAEQLTKEYANNSKSADKRFLNRNVEVTGKVKAFYKLLNTRNVLELRTNIQNQNLFCFFTIQAAEFNASKLGQGRVVTVKGKCLGKEAYKFVNGIKIEVNEIISK